MFNIVAIGELLIDFTPIKTAEGIFYKQNAGGAPCNMLTMASKLGSKTTFIGKVGNDSFGKFLGNVLTNNGVDTTGLVFTNKYNTTLAFVHLDNKNDRSFSFYRDGCADVMLSKQEIDYEVIKSSQVMHFGSLSFTNEPSSSAVEEAVNYAKAQGKLITYDPNYRPALWSTVQNAVKGMEIGLKYADIIKVSEEEAELITGESDLVQAAKSFCEYGIKLVCITLGDKGSFYYHRNGSGVVHGFNSNVKDTTGAGDAFFGAVVHQVISDNIDLNNISKEKIEKALLYANAAASLCIEKLGGIPSMPSKEAVEQRLSSMDI